MKNKAQLDGMPVWFDGKSINEALFCEEFLQTHKIIYTNGAFFTPEGRVTDELPLRGEIFEELKCCAVSNIPRKISNIVEADETGGAGGGFSPGAGSDSSFQWDAFSGRNLCGGKAENRPQPFPRVLQAQRPATCSLAAISGWPALPGGHPPPCRNISATA